ncbi:MAG TPA: tRNA (adenosine(37)-N6)-dimethylallyltransferase MiaA [Candidatus Limnocylindrales bacterium]|nr:tRNA (adenosine(37)-N6)-dimethylallyltransferase MiaA [Candidatus Limnocylindrales bacterium]
MSARIPLVVLLGPTAVGKTGLALALAEAFDGEIVGADSRQIYRGLDIGSAKPTLAQQTRAPHHLIDVVEPDETLSLAEYQTLATAAIADIARRGRLPLLVGGTGQYLTALVEGWRVPRVPPDPQLRAELEQYAAEHGGDALFARLLAADPAAEAFVDGRNLRRVIRALEVTTLTCEPFSAQRRSAPPPYDIIQFGLTLERDALYARADQRIGAMMAAGFLDEVRGLLARGLNRRLPSLSALGYTQLAAHLLDGLPLADALEQTRFATHNYIRRQYTWFRGHDRGIHWMDASSAEPLLIEAVSRWLAGRERSA